MDVSTANLNVKSFNRNQITLLEKLAFVFQTHPYF